jgi:hypothetical protein
MLALTDKELKLLRLGLDPAAKEGEIQGASRKLFDSLRLRGVTAQQVEASLSGQSLNHNTGSDEYRRSRPDFGKCVIPFKRSKYYGVMFMDIPPSDLRSTLEWIDSKEELRQRFATVAQNIREFFKQSQPT